MTGATDEFVPVIEIEIRPKAKADQPKLFDALARLAADDMQFRFTMNDETGAAMLAGVDELQLDQKIDAIRRIDLADITVGAPQICYRETITRSVTIEYTHKKLRGSAGEFAHVKLVCDPPSAASSYASIINVVTDMLPKEYRAGIERGITTGLSFGIFAGFPVIGLTARLVDGAYHDTDSSPLAFEIAARGAVREALVKGEPVVLEPVMKIDVVSPKEYAGRITDDLKLRRGKVIGQAAHANASNITALVPAANMFGYFNSLREMSRGRATYTMRFDHYSPIPPSDDPPFSPAIGMRA